MKQWTAHAVEVATMATSIMDTRDGRARRWRREGRAPAAADAVYGLGLIGALVFYIQQADGFWQGVVGVLKALVWPAFLVYELLKSFAT
jgi:hypothetical protein